MAKTEKPVLNRVGKLNILIMANTVSSYKPGEELSSLDFGNLIGGPLKAVVEAQAQAAESTVKFIKNVGFEPDSEDSDGNFIPGAPVYVSFKYPKLLAPFQQDVDLSDAVKEIELDDLTVKYDVKPDITFTPAGAEPADTVGSIQSAEAKAILNDDDLLIGIEITNSGSGYTLVPTVVITYTGTLAPPTAPNATAVLGKKSDYAPAVYQDMKIDVPLLSIVPIPFIQVRNAEIEFNAKINSVERTQNTDRTNSARSNISGRSGSFSASAGGSFLGFGGRASGSYSSYSRSYASVANTKTTYSGTKVEKTFSMRIKINAVQDEIPEGMETLLRILEKSTLEVPLI